ncbi:MAG: ArdC family protein [Pseudomonadota bacterium]
MTKLDTYQQVTDSIVAAIEAGTKPWECSWTMGEGGSLVPLRANGQPYRGINVLLLWLAASANSYRSGRWLTFKQAQALGGKVRKGEKSTRIVFFKTLEVDADKAGGDGAGRGEGDEDGKRRVGMLRQYNVFNADQIDGLPSRFAPPVVELVAGKERDEAAEAAIRSCGAAIADDGGAQAYYRPDTDSIHLPAFDRFNSVGGYLATMAHEVMHWTGAPSRLARFKAGKVATAEYAFEELVAEIGAAFICARLGIAGEHIDNHAAYVEHWLKALKNDKRAIFRAASLAQAAADLALANAGEATAVDYSPVERPAAAPAVEVRAQLALAL